MQKTDHQIGLKYELVGKSPRTLVVYLILALWQNLQALDESQTKKDRSFESVLGRGVQFYDGGRKSEANQSSGTRLCFNA